MSSSHLVPDRRPRLLVWRVGRLGDVLGRLHDLLQHQEQDVSQERGFASRLISMHPLRQQTSHRSCSSHIPLRDITSTPTIFNGPLGSFLMLQWGQGSSSNMIPKNQVRPLVLRPLFSRINPSSTDAHGLTLPIPMHGLMLPVQGWMIDGSIPSGSEVMAHPKDMHSAMIRTRLARFQMLGREKL